MSEAETGDGRAEAGGMSRQDLIRAILTVDCDFPVDFTGDYLAGLSTEKLQHIYVALRTRGKRPEA